MNSYDKHTNKKMLSLYDDFRNQILKDILTTITISVLSNGDKDIIFE